MRGTLTIDYDASEFWARLVDGTSIITTPKFQLKVVPKIEGVLIYEDDRGSRGLDLDDIVLTTTATPVIKPTTGGNTGNVTISLHNFGLLSGAAVRLTSPGLPDIVGQNTGVIEPTLTRTTFNLLGASPGVRNVVITIPNKPTQMLPAGGGQRELTR